MRSTRGSKALGFQMLWTLQGSLQVDPWIMFYGKNILT